MTIFADGNVGEGVYFAVEGQAGFTRHYLGFNYESQVVVTSDDRVQILGREQDGEANHIGLDTPPQNIRLTELVSYNDGDADFAQTIIGEYWIPACDPLTEGSYCEEGCVLHGSLDEPMVECGVSGYVDFGEVCETNYDCMAGLVCAEMAGQWCPGSACCTSFCDRFGPDTCAQGTSCQALWTTTAPFGLDDVGACRD